MSNERISEKQVQYLSSFYPESESMKQSKKNGEEIQKGYLSISFWEGQILHFLCQLSGAKKIVEIGTFTGYSAQWMAQNLTSDSILYTIESDEEHFKRAEKVLASHHQIKCMKGPALEVLKKLEKESPFDLIFIDANKNGYVDYLDWATQNVNPGGLILADNVFLGGRIFDSKVDNQYTDKQVDIMKQFNKKISENPNFISVILPTFEGLMAAYYKPPGFLKT